MTYKSQSVVFLISHSFSYLPYSYCKIASSIRKENWSVLLLYHPQCLEQFLEHSRYSLNIFVKQMYELLKNKIK